MHGHAIAHIIREAIRNGEIAQGQLLPSRPDLARRLGVELADVVRAYDVLEREGLIWSPQSSSRRGEGAFVR